jgi:hypothetical protein
MNRVPHHRFRELAGIAPSGASVREIANRAYESARLPLSEGRKELAKQALETNVQSAITQYLDAQRIPYARTDATESYNRKGQRVCRVNSSWPDLTGVYAGYCLCIEVKRAIGGRLSYEQADCLNRLYQAGALVVIARSVSEVEDLLRTKRTSAATIDEIVRTLNKGPKLRRRSR